MTLSEDHVHYTTVNSQQSSSRTDIPIYIYEGLKNQKEREEVREAVEEAIRDSDFVPFAWVIAETYFHESGSDPDHVMLKAYRHDEKFQVAHIYRDKIWYGKNYDLFPRLWMNEEWETNRQRKKQAHRKFRKRRSGKKA